MFRHFLINKICPSFSVRFYSSNLLFHSPKVKQFFEKNDQFLQIIDNYITDEEYQNFLKEIDRDMKRKRYEFSHWDDAIHGYRESEKSEWKSENTEVLTRLRQFAFDDPSQSLVHVHILDISKDGYIKPHIDAIRYCGTTIAGLSFLSSSVMRLIHKDDPTMIIDLLLHPKSLYILKNPFRFDFTHEILKPDQSYFNKTPIPRDRRLSIICRNPPLDPTAG